MTDDEVNRLSLNNKTTMFMVEYRKVDLERDSHYVTTNFEQAKTKATTMAKDTMFRNVKLHRITVEKTWTPVASVEFQSEEDVNA